MIITRGHIVVSFCWTSFTVHLDGLSPLWVPVSAGSILAGYWVYARVIGRPTRPGWVVPA